MAGTGAKRSGRTPNGKKDKSEPKRKLRSRGSRKERVAQLLEDIEEHLDIGEMRITLADFIRLTQLERELAQEDEPKEIVVTWKDPSEKSAG